MITQPSGGQSAGHRERSARQPKFKEPSSPESARGGVSETARGALFLSAKRVADARAFRYHSGRTLLGVFVREVPRGLTYVPIRFAAPFIKMSAIEETNVLPRGGTTASKDSPSATERVVLAAIGASIALLPWVLSRAFGETFGEGLYSPTFTVVTLLVTGAVCWMGGKRTLDLLSSVRFGVVMLILLAAASFIGMIVMQQNV